MTACEKCEAVVGAVLRDLSRTINEQPGWLQIIRFAGYVGWVSVFGADHARVGVSKGWHLAGCGDPEKKSALKGVWPYWMRKEVGIGNDVDFDKMVVLTAPNMSGKSTVMRASAAAALLTMCGLFSPTRKGSHVKNYNTVFFRGASSDVPSEGKSAFGKECEDVSEMFLECDEESLVFIDELGRGTSPKDGTALAGAVLEGMCDRGFSGFFATHLHGILELDINPTARDRTRNMRMGVEENGDDEVEWTYSLEDGVSKDSLALVTAKR